ncbi:MAG TPA: hypothetical protein VLB44_24240, partial [Kofleriaceae bacterium]|nr:hypothetical protein [Kofleriaceae bacterium]
TGLDPSQIVEIRDLVKDLAKKSTVLLSTHILSEVEATCDRVLVIMKGELRADAKLAELRESNAAVIAIEASAEGVKSTLENIDGVTAVESVGTIDDLERWRVTSKADGDLCVALYDTVKHKPWKVGELRHEPKSLERVFKDLAEVSQ